MTSTRTFAAGGFVCDCCGVRNYFDLVAIDPENVCTDFPAADPSAFAPLGPVEVYSEFLIEPTVVSCKLCGARFRVDNRN